VGDGAKHFHLSGQKLESTRDQEKAKPNRQGGKTEEMESVRELLEAEHFLGAGRAVGKTLV
jgi:hypothetical protein